MSRASNTSKHSRRPSKTSNPDGGQHQTHHSDEQPPPENHIVGPTGGEKEMSGPSTLPPGISNAPSPPSKLHPDSTFNDSPNGLAPEAVDVVVQQPKLSDLKDIMDKVLDILQYSTIASKDGRDDRSRFWTVYKRVAEEHDGEFLERSSSDMDIVLIFSGLFSAVSTSFIVAMESSLSPDPSETTNALLTQLVQIGLGNLAAAGVEPSPWSPSTLNVRIQAIAYASLSMSLLAAFGAVLGKQWLGYYKASRYGRGSLEERGRRRNEKFDGITTWYFEAVLQSFPVLLQLSLLLFGIALSANMWYEQHSIAWVIIATTVFGFLFYSLTLMAALVSPACPFQTPISTILCILHVDRALRPMVKLALRYFQRLLSVLHVLLRTLRLLYKILLGSVGVVYILAWCCLLPLYGALYFIYVRWLRSLVVRSPVQVEDSEAQSSDRNPDIVAKNPYHVDLHLPDISTNDLEAPSIKWLLETSTDPEVFFAAASLVPHVEWPLDLDVSETLHQLYEIYESCLDVQSRIVPSLEKKASVCTMALSHLYCGRALQACTGNGFLRIEISGSWYSQDFQVFGHMIAVCKAQDEVLALTARLSRQDPWDSLGVLALTARLSHQLEYSLDDERHQLPIEFANSAPEWLSHILPYHFVAGRVDEDVEKLAVAVISRLLSVPSSPSTQTIANCTLLACLMIGIQFDKKYIVRIDKSSALDQLVKSLGEQCQTMLWSDVNVHGVGAAPRRVLDLTDVICHVLQRPQSSSQVAWSLDLCRKIYSRARSSEQHNPRPALRQQQRFQRFMFDVFRSDTLEPHNPNWVWHYRVPFKDNSHSPEDFDWLVDYLDAVYSSDNDTACDILVLMSSMRVSCSPAKQHLFIESLIGCMDGSMPVRLRHLALRAADSSREVLTWIDAVDDADTVLTEFSPAIMSAVCPRPGATPAADDLDRLFNDERDLCYLRLVFALTRNSIWHPHLVGDHHIDRCTRIIAECCQLSPSYYIPNMLGVLLQTTPEQVSVISLQSITEQQWWNMIGHTWTVIYSIFTEVEVKDSDELLPILVGGTQKYMQIASKSDLEQLIKDVNRVFRKVEQQGLECIDDVKELGTVARGMLQRFGQ